jgi:hypothetical protein
MGVSVRAWLFAALAALLVGCQTVDREQVASLRTIGVVVVGADRLHLVQVGATIFGNRTHQIDVSAWRIDDAIYRAVLAEARREPGFEYREVRVNRAEFPDLFKLNYQFEFDLTAAKPDLMRVVALCACDALLLVHPSWMRDSLIDQRYGGLTWQAYTINDMPRGSHAFAGFAYQLLSAADLRNLGWATNRLNNDRFADFAGIDNYVRANKDLWPNSQSSLTDQQRGHIETLLVQVISSTTRAPLYQLHLRPSCKPYAEARRLHASRASVSVSGSSNPTPEQLAADAEVEKLRKQCLG